MLLALSLPVLACAAPAPHTPTPPSLARRSSPGYGTITTTQTGPVIRAEINNPPINLWDYKLAADFSSFVSSLAAETNNTNTTNAAAPKVVIFSSANPDFFIAHLDIHTLSTASPELPPGNSTETISQLGYVYRALPTLPIISIIEIDGRATGAGSELAVQADIRYAGPNARLSQFEITFGLPPGGGAVQYLTQLIGRARALEYILSGRSVDARTAAAFGWVNAAFDSHDKLTAGVDALAQRIAAFPATGLAAIKERVNSRKPTDEEVQVDFELFTSLGAEPESQALDERYLELSANQTPNEFELNIPEDLVEVETV